jgi:hypothetical protein
VLSRELSRIGGFNADWGSGQCSHGSTSCLPWQNAGNPIGEWIHSRCRHDGRGRDGRPGPAVLPAVLQQSLGGEGRVSAIGLACCNCRLSMQNPHLHLSVPRLEKIWRPCTAPSRACMQACDPCRAVTPVCPTVSSRMGSSGAMWVSCCSFGGVGGDHAGNRCGVLALQGTSCVAWQLQRLPLFQCHSEVESGSAVEGGGADGERHEEVASMLDAANFSGDGCCCCCCCWAGGFGSCRGVRDRRGEGINHNPPFRPAQWRRVNFMLRSSWRSR